MDSNLPSSALGVDPILTDVGSDHPFQRVIYARTCGDARWLVIAQLLQPHSEGAVGRFYGVMLRGIAVDGRIRPWRTEPLGEVSWHPEQGWVQTPACSA